jgi:hypothetical protein
VLSKGERFNTEHTENTEQRFNSREDREERETGKIFLEAGVTPSPHLYATLCCKVREEECVKVLHFAKMLQVAKVLQRGKVLQVRAYLTAGLSTVPGEG